MNNNDKINAVFERFKALLIQEVLTEEPKAPVMPAPAPEPAKRRKVTSAAYKNKMKLARCVPVLVTFKSGEKFIAGNMTLAAKAAGVGIGTVSEALSGKGRKSDKGLRFEYLVLTENVYKVVGVGSV